MRAVRVARCEGSEGRCEGSEGSESEGSDERAVRGCAVLRGESRGVRAVRAVRAARAVRVARCEGSESCEV